MQKMASLWCVVMSRIFVSLFCLLLLFFSLEINHVSANNAGKQCLHYQNHNDSWRSIKHAFNPNDRHCDENTINVDQWFSVGSTPGARIPTECVKNDICGAKVAMWIDMAGQDVPDGEIIHAHLCGSFNVLDKYDCCVLRTPVKVSNCSGRLIYNLLKPIDRCPVAICSQEENEELPEVIKARFGDKYFETKNETAKKKQCCGVEKDLKVYESGKSSCNELDRKDCIYESTTESTTSDGSEVISHASTSDTPSSQSEVSAAVNDTSKSQVTSDDINDVSTSSTTKSEETTSESSSLTETTQVMVSEPALNETLVTGPVSSDKTEKTSSDNMTSAAAAAPSPAGDVTSSTDTVERAESTKFHQETTETSPTDLPTLQRNASLDDSATSASDSTSTTDETNDVVSALTTMGPTDKIPDAVGTPEQTTEATSTMDSSPLAFIEKTTTEALTLPTDVPSPPPDNKTSAAAAGETVLPVHTDTTLLVSPVQTDTTHLVSPVQTDTTHLISPVHTDITHPPGQSTDEDSMSTSDETTPRKAAFDLVDITTPTLESTSSTLVTSTDMVTETTTGQRTSVSDSVQESSSEEAANSEQDEAQSTLSPDSPGASTVTPTTIKSSDSHTFSVYVVEIVKLIFKGPLFPTKDAKYIVTNKMSNFLRYVAQQEVNDGRKASFNLTPTVDTCENSYNDTCIKLKIQSSGRGGMSPIFKTYPVIDYYTKYSNYTLLTYCIVENDGGCAELYDGPKAQASKTQFERNAAVYITVIVLCVVCVVVIAVGIFCTKVWRRGTYTAGDNVERAAADKKCHSEAGNQSPFTDEQIMKDELGTRPEVVDKGSSNGSALDGGENSTWVIPLDDAPDFPPPNNEDTKL